MPPPLPSGFRIRVKPGSDLQEKNKILIQPLKKKQDSKPIFDNKKPRIQIDLREKTGSGFYPIFTK